MWPKKRCSVTRRERVEAIHVRVGALSGIVKDALLAAYELAREQTPFADARLIFEDVPVVVFCKHCQAERGVQSVQQLCCVECDTPARHPKYGAAANWSSPRWS